MVTLSDEVEVLDDWHWPTKLGKKKMAWAGDFLSWKQQNQQSWKLVAFLKYLSLQDRRLSCVHADVWMIQIFIDWNRARCRFYRVSKHERLPCSRNREWRKASIINCTEDGLLTLLGLGSTVFAYFSVSSRIPYCPPLQLPGCCLVACSWCCLPLPTMRPRRRHSATYKVQAKSIIKNQCMLSRSEFFKGSSEKFLLELSTMLEVDLFLPGQDIIQQGAAVGRGIVNKLY